MHGSRHIFAGLALILAGAAITEPLLGRFLAADRQLDFPANAIVWTVALYLVLSGVLAILWNGRIPATGMTGKQCLIRLVALSIPVVLLLVVESALILRDRANQPLDADDRHSTRIRERSEGKVRYKGFNLFQASADPLFHVNSHGFRAHPFDVPRAGEYRIMLLGGSTAFGWEVADHHTIGSYIERELSLRSGRTVHVYNLGVPGAQFKQEVSLLSDFKQKIRPDLVLFYHGANDGLAWYQQTVGRAKAKQTLTPDFFSLETLLHYAYRVRIFRETSNFIASMGSGNSGGKIDVSQAVADYRRVFEAASDSCSGTSCMFVLQPIIFDRQRWTASEIVLRRNALLNWPSYDIMYRRYIDGILDAGLPQHVDARPAISRPAEIAFLDIVHMSPAGNRSMAEVIGAGICAAGFLVCDNRTK